jgi:hypothetical protein
MMKTLLAIACVLFLLVSLGMAADIPSLSGNVNELSEPPFNTPHGPATNGLTLGLWSEKPAYELNSRMNVWIILSNTNKDSSGRIIPYDPAIHKDDYLTITTEDGSQMKIKGDHPSDGPIGWGFAGGISAQLHAKIRRPGVYTLQWKIGAMESNVIKIEVVRPTSEGQRKAQSGRGE